MPLVLIRQPVVLAGWRPGEGLPAFGGASTFSRGSAAYQVGSSGAITSAATNTLRDAHYVGAVGSGERTALLEPSRQNLVLRACDFANAAWSYAGSLTRTNAASAVAGQTASLIADDGTNAFQNVFQVFGTFTGATGTATFIVEAHGSSVITDIGIYDNTANGFVARARFTWATGTLTQNLGSGGVTARQLAATGPNGGALWRLTITGSGPSGAARRLSVYPSGWNRTAAESCYLHGVQFEGSSAFATSLVPTAGASVTRSADALSLSLPAGERYERYYDLATAAFVDSITTGSAGSYSVPNARAYTHVYTFIPGYTLAQARTYLGV